MAEPKNPFDFGTGSIDKDQWLRDIDAEQGDFVSRYSSAVNKHRAALMREAFADLRRRIANGDMLNRTADGLYQFGSALSREDKHMQEAYQRALGFMGDLARRQIQAPPAAEPEKKKYSTKTLNERFIKYFNPSGSQESFTSLWNSYDDAKRKEQILKFLRDELNNGLSNYQDVEDYESLDKLKERINEFLSDSNITNLNRLGFTKNYLSLLKTEELEEEAPKSEEELLDELLAAQQQLKIIQLKRDAINYGNNAQVIRYDFSTPLYDILNDIINQTKHTRPGLNLTGITPDWNKNYADLLKQYINSSTKELNDYFSNFAVNYLSILSDKNNIPTLSRNLARLFATIPGKTPESPQLIYDWNKYLTRLPSGEFMINGTLDNNSGRFLLYNNRGISSTNLTNMDLSTLEFLRKLLKLNLGTSGYMKDGGVIKGQNGLDFSTVSLNTPLPLLKVEETPKSKEDADQGMTTADWVNIAGPLALDITSMISANASPGVGTIVSGVSGLGSTLWSGIADISREGINGTNLGLMGTGALADLFGLVPGWGISAKVGKIAGRLTKYGRFLMQGLKAAGYSNAASVLYKGISGGFENLNYDDWKTLSAGISGAVKGHSSIRRSNRANLERGAATKTKVTYKDGKTELIDTDVATKLLAEGKITNISKPIVTLETLRDTLTKIAERMSLPQYFGLSTNRFNSMWNKAGTEGYSNWNNVELPGIKYNKEAYLDKIKGLRTKAEDVKEKAKSAIKGNDTPKASSEPTKKKAAKKKTSKAQKKEIGGVLKALRNGGIVKAQEGLKTDGLTNRYDNISDWTKLNFGVTEKLYFPGFMKARYDNRGNVLYPHSSFAEQEEGEHFGDLSTNSAYEAQLSYYLKDNGSHIFGDVLNAYNTWKSENNGTVQDFINYYNGEVDWLRSQGLKKLLSKANSGGWKEYNQRFNNLYSNYSSYDPRLENIIGESTWQRTPNTFKGITDLTDLRLGILGVGEDATLVAIDNLGHLITDNLINPKGDIRETGKETKKEGSKVTDSEGELKTVPETKYKNPTDPTPYIIAGKTAMGLLGNRNIYKNLLDEMPQAPLRDPIDRKLAIVGWQEAIKQGLNQLADLRNATWMQHGSNLLDNLAGMYETEGKGRDIMNGQYMKDSGRQFETALKSWNLDNEDILYNLGVGDANRRAIADRARMMAQIRAAWRSGDNNIIMGALSDAGNWMMKNYQRESDLIDLVKQLQLGTREQFMENYVRNKHSDYDSLKAKLVDPNTSDTEKANIRTKIQQWHLDAIKEAPEQWGLKLYNSFHRPGFGGGPYTTIAAKDGTKLEVAKLKARSKDNDRYVSMIKDLRTTRYRRRRR